MTGRGESGQPRNRGVGAKEAAPLNAFQRNSLGITLRLADEALRDVMRLLDEPSFEEAMHGVADDLGPEQKQAIAEEVRRARVTIRQLRARFALTPEIHQKSRLILGRVIPAWEVVMEGRARSLRGYGPLAPGLAEDLDPWIERLGAIVLRIEALARHGITRQPRDGGGPG